MEPNKKEEQGNFKTAFLELLNGKAPLEEEHALSGAAVNVQKEKGVVAPFQSAHRNALSPKSTTVLSEDVEITGNVKATGSIEVRGTITGDVLSEGHLTVSGKIKGNVKAISISVNGGEIVADEIQCAEKMVVAKNSHIQANIVAQSIEVNAKVSGNLNIKGACTLNESTEIFGNITSSSISVTTGTIIKGTITIGTAE